MELWNKAIALDELGPAELRIEVEDKDFNILSKKTINIILKQKETPEQTTIEIMGPDNTTINTPTTFTVNQISGEEIKDKKYYWLIGDGKKTESQETDRNTLTHTFPKQGEYSIEIYFLNKDDTTYNENDTTITATKTITVKGEESNFIRFTKLVNPTVGEIDLTLPTSDEVETTRKSNRFTTRTYQKNANRQYRIAPLTKDGDPDETRIQIIEATTKNRIELDFPKDKYPEDTYSLGVFLINDKGEIITDKDNIPYGDSIMLQLKEDERIITIIEPKRDINNIYEAPKPTKEDPLIVKVQISKDGLEKDTSIDKIRLTNKTTKEVLSEILVEDIPEITKQYHILRHEILKLEESTTFAAQVLDGETVIQEDTINIKVLKGLEGIREQPQIKFKELETKERGKVSLVTGEKQYTTRNTNTLTLEVNKTVTDKYPNAQRVLYAIAQQGEREIEGSEQIVGTSKQDEIRAMFPQEKFPYNIYNLYVFLEEGDAYVKDNNDNEIFDKITIEFNDESNKIIFQITKPQQNEQVSLNRDKSIQVHVTIPQELRDKATNIQSDIYDNETHIPFYGEKTIEDKDNQIIELSYTGEQITSGEGRERVYLLKDHEVIQSVEKNIIITNSGNSEQIEIISPQENEEIQKEEQITATIKIPQRISNTSTRIVGEIQTNNTTYYKGSELLRGEQQITVQLNKEQDIRTTNATLKVTTYNRDGGMTGEDSIQLIFNQQDTEIIITSPVRNNEIYTGGNQFILKGQLSQTDKRITQYHVKIQDMFETVIQETTLTEIDANITIPYTGDTLRVIITALDNNGTRVTNNKGDVIQAVFSISLSETQPLRIILPVQENEKYNGKKPTQEEPLEIQVKIEKEAIEDLEDPHAFMWYATKTDGSREAIANQIPLDENADRIILHDLPEGTTKIGIAVINDKNEILAHSEIEFEEILSIEQFEEEMPQEEFIIPSIPTEKSLSKRGIATIGADIMRFDKFLKMHAIQGINHEIERANGKINMKKDIDDTIKEEFNREYENYRGYNGLFRDYKEEAKNIRKKAKKVVKDTTNPEEIEAFLKKKDKTEEEQTVATEMENTFKATKDNLINYFNAIRNIIRILKKAGFTIKRKVRKKEEVPYF